MPQLVWFRQLLDPMKKNFFKKQQKFAFRENRKIPYEKPIFFSRQAIPKVFFALHFHYTVDSLFRVWYDLNNSLTRWRGPVFNIPFSRKSKVPYEILTFFLGKMYQKFFLLYTFITLVTIHPKLGLILTTSWPDEKELFLKFARTRNSRNSQNFVWKTKIFPGQNIPKFLLFYPLLTLVIVHATIGLI